MPTNIHIYLLICKPNRGVLFTTHVKTKLEFYKGLLLSDKTY